MRDKDTEADLVGKVVDRHLAAKTVAHRYAVKVHNTPAARKKYLRKHPKANPKNHIVKKKNDAKGKSKEPNKEHLKEAGIPTGTKLPRSTKDAIATKEGREAISNFTVKSKAKRFGKAILDAVKNPKELVKALGTSAVREVRNVGVNTPSILKDCLKEGRKPSKEKQKWPKGCDEPGSKTKCSVGEASEMDILYGSSVYAMGVAVTAGFGGASGALAGIAMGKAFLNSLTLHIGIGAMSQFWDGKFLHAEVGQDVATMSGGSIAKAVSEHGSGSIDGLGSIFEAVATLAGKTVGVIAAEDFQSILEDQEMIRLAKEDDEDALMEKFMDFCLKSLCAKLDQGFSQEEIKSLLELDPKEYT
tara:strand:+ start:2568 stop:3644 length:1077 start_codon:yes stop_codon:yes gene_type:complete